jgi:hypothetical protein
MLLAEVPVSAEKHFDGHLVAAQPGDIAGVRSFADPKTEFSDAANRVDDEFRDRGWRDGRLRHASRSDG